MARGEKQYQSASEHRRNAALRANTTTTGAANIQGRLPFGHCALTLRPFTADSVVVINPANPTVWYESTALMPFVLQHQRDPCTGATCIAAQLVTLQFERNAEGAWQCPVLAKTLNAHSKIVAIRQQQSAHVYSYTAYKTLNVQGKNYTDLTTGEPFDPVTDVLILQDPDNQTNNTITSMEQFYYIQHADQFRSDNDNHNAAATNIRHSATATRILAQLDKKKQQQTQSTTSKRRVTANAHDDDDNDDQVILAQDVTGVALTTAAGAASLTSTGVTTATHNAARPATKQEILESQCRMLRSLKTKGHVRLHTNVGTMVLEIHTDIVPRTAKNFLGLCAAGRYDNTTFHRLIPGFMVQGGKAPKGQADASLWGDEAFADEFDDRLKHDAAGVVAMANAGPHTNKQQFYITFAACPHLNRKHSVFGQVVQGMDILKQIEGVGADTSTDKPLTKLVIEQTEILVNPVETAKAKEKKRIQKLQQARAQKAGGPVAKKTKVADETSTDNDEGIGKYLKNRLANRGGGSGSSSSARGGIKDVVASAGTSSAKRKPQAPKKTAFGNFSGW